RRCFSPAHRSRQAAHEGFHRRRIFGIVRLRGRTLGDVDSSRSVLERSGAVKLKIEAARGGGTSAKKSRKLKEPEGGRRPQCGRTDYSLTGKAGSLEWGLILSQ